MNDRSRKETKGEPAAQRRLSKRPGPVVVPLPGTPDDDELASLAARLIAAEQAKKRAEEREREATARATAAEARSSDGAGAIPSELARRLAELSLRIVARESAAERELAELRTIKADVGEVMNLLRRAGAGGVGVAMTEPAPRRSVRTLSGSKRPR